MALLISINRSSVSPVVQPKNFDIIFTFPFSYIPHPKFKSSCWFHFPNTSQNPAASQHLHDHSLPWCEPSAFMRILPEWLQQIPDTLSDPILGLYPPFPIKQPLRFNLEPPFSTSSLPVSYFSLRIKLTVLPRVHKATNPHLIWPLYLYHHILIP